MTSYLISAETVFVPLIRHCCTDPEGPEAEAHIQEIKVRHSSTAAPCTLIFNFCILISQFTVCSMSVQAFYLRQDCTSYRSNFLLTVLCVQEIVSKGYAQAFWTAYREIIRRKLGLKVVIEEVTPACMQHQR